YLAATAPVMIAPAMNATMWEQPATKRNVARLRRDGVHFVEPVAGELACKTVGTGKLEDVENIITQAMAMLVQGPMSKGQGQGEIPKTLDVGHRTLDLAAERFLITVGGTREA